MPIDTWRTRLPNALTLARVTLTIALVAILANADPLRGTNPRADLLAAAILFSLAAATDALDGYLARRWDAVTTVGRILDPFADKLLVLGTLVLLTGPAMTLGTDAGPRPAAGFAGWMVVVILARELLVTALRGVLESAGADFSATASGKLKMILQSLAIPACMLVPAIWNANPPPWAHNSAAAAAWATTLVTAWSAVPYIRRSIPWITAAGARP